MKLSSVSFVYFGSALLARFPHAAHAGITAFSGNNCDGAAGLNVPCDGSCHQFGGRHSFRVDSGSGDHCVTVWREAGCPGLSSESFSFPDQDGGCQNVDTGTDVESFVCSPNLFCTL